MVTTLSILVGLLSIALFVEHIHRRDVQAEARLLKRQLEDFAAAVRFGGRAFCAERELWNKRYKTVKVIRAYAPTADQAGMAEDESLAAREWRSRDLRANIIPAREITVAQCQKEHFRRIVTAKPIGRPVTFIAKPAY